jgi:hypothetical protein
MAHNCSGNSKTMDSMPVSGKTAGQPESLKNKTLETGAAAVQVRMLNSI